MTRESKYSGGAVLDEVYCHDDRLVFRGQKKEVKLDAFWWQVVPKTGACIMVEARDRRTATGDRNTDRARLEGLPRQGGDARQGLVYLRGRLLCRH